MGVGSIAGALVTGAHGRTGPRLIAGGALAFGVLALLAAAMPTLALEMLAAALLGAAAVTFAATINSTLQLAVAPEMRGRVMALYSVVFLGSTPIGGPLAGWLAEAYDPRVALLLAGISGLSAAWAAQRLLRPDLSGRRGRTSGGASRSRPRRRVLRDLAGVAGRLQVFGGRLLRRLLFEFDPGVELLHDLQRQALLDLDDRLFVVGPGFFGDRLAR